MPYESNRGRGGRGGHHGGSFGRTAGSGTSREPYNRDLTVADTNIGTHHSDRGAFGNRGRGTINSLITSSPCHISYIMIGRSQITQIEIFSFRVSTLYPR